MTDLIIAVFINTKNLPYMQGLQCAEDIVKRLRKAMDDSRVEIYVFPSDHDDIKAIPVKCYLEGTCPDIPDNIEELIEKLSNLVF